MSTYDEAYLYRQTDVDESHDNSPPGLRRSEDFGIYSDAAPKLQSEAWLAFLFIMFAALDILTSAFLLADLIQYVVTIVIFLLLCFSFQSSQYHTQLLDDQVRACHEQILGLRNEKGELIARLQTSEEETKESNARNQALSAQYTDSLALRQTEQTQHDDVVRQYRKLELDHAVTLRTLELRNSQLDEVQTRRNTELTAMTEDRDRLSETLTRANRRHQRAQASLRNLWDIFPDNAEALLSAPHQIPGIVLTKDGRPDLHYREGKPFRNFRNERSSVLHEGRRTYLLLTAVSE